MKRIKSAVAGFARSVFFVVTLPITATWAFWPSLWPWLLAGFVYYQIAKHH